MNFYKELKTYSKMMKKYNSFVSYAAKHPETAKFHDDHIEDFKHLSTLNQSLTRLYTKNENSNEYPHMYQAHINRLKTLYQAAKDALDRLSQAYENDQTIPRKNMSYFNDMKSYLEKALLHRWSAQKFMPANTFVVFPDGPLGKTWFGTTPAESDLMSGAAANVAITDTGVAVPTKSASGTNVTSPVAGSMVYVPSPSTVSVSVSLPLSSKSL